MWGISGSLVAFWRFVLAVVEVADPAKALVGEKLPGFVGEVMRLC